jgi:sarcosine oxidase
MYTMSRDEHFIVGADRELPGLWYGAGLSGHGFKLVPALGELLATGIATGHDPSPPLFRAARFRVTG